MSFSHDNRRRLWRALVFVWLFLTTILVKVEGREGVFPFHRYGILLALPVVMLWSFSSIQRARLSVAQWLLLLVVAYLIAYPFLTMLFAALNARDLKDAAYTVSIYAVLLFFLKRYFTTTSGTLDVPTVGWFCVAFALLEAVLALALRTGAELRPGFGPSFIQQPWLDGRLHGLMGSPSHLAPVLAVAGLFLLTRRPTVASTGALALLIISLVMTGSRSALLGFCVAAALFAAIRAPGLRISARRLAQSALVLVILASVFYSFADRAIDVMEMAVRVDPPNWERSRFVIWTVKLSQFAQSGIVTQMFGDGYRAEASTFNLNVEFLINHGIVYFVVFNGLYLLVLVGLTLQAAATRDVDTSFLVTVAAFTYVFSQGLNFILHEFLTFVHLAVALVMVGYFEYLSPVGGTATRVLIQPHVPIRQMLPEANSC